MSSCSSCLMSFQSSTSCNFTRLDFVLNGEFSDFGVEDCFGFEPVLASWLFGVELEDLVTVFGFG